MCMALTYSDNEMLVFGSTAWRVWCISHSSDSQLVEQEKISPVGDFCSCSEYFELL